MFHTNSNIFRRFLEAAVSKELKKCSRNLCKTNINPNNPSRETRLEREIVQLDQNAWFNQIPVASGVLGSREDKRCAVDLIHHYRTPTGKEHYALIELKVESDTPLYAAFEVLRYGLLYLVSRSSKLEDYSPKRLPLFAADGIHLRVLAPRKFYEGSKLGWLEQSLSQGVNIFARKFEIEMDFAFLKLGINLEKLARAYDTESKIMTAESSK